MGGGPLAGVRIVLVRPRQPGNVGAAARAIANYGAGGLTLVAPRGYDPERARWMAPGATAIVDEARIVEQVSEAVAEARLVVGTTGRGRRWSWPVLDPLALAEAVLGAPGEVAILFGPEDKGLSNEDLALCHAILSLPTASHASLNLAQAVTVTCAGLFQEALLAGAEAPTAERQRPRRGASARWAGPPPDPTSAPVGQQAALVDLATSVLAEIEYLDGRSEEQVRGSLFRLLGRAGPTSDELHFLLGMLKSVRHQLRARSGPTRSSSDPGE